MKKINRKIFYILTTVFSINMVTLSVEATDYEKEAEAAAKGSDWYSQSLVPSQQEIEGNCYLGMPEHIKIRLPLDLGRVVDEYRTTDKPVSVAVSCGDRELPWRANFAAQMNDSARPITDDYWKLLATDTINHNLNTENYISIDPLLGIKADEEEGYLYRSSGRGAGHFIMDAMNPEHWEQFSDFLKQNNIQLHQIIFTAGMGDPVNSLHKKDTILSNQVGILEPTGKLVNPYFLTYSKKYSNSRFEFLSLLPQAQIVNDWELYLFDCFQIGKIFEEESPQWFEFNSNKYCTRYMPFVQLCQDHKQKKNIEDGISSLVEQKFPTDTEAYKTFLKEMAVYFVSIANLDEIFNENNKKSSHASELEQMKNIIPIYQKYFESAFGDFGLSVEFLTSPQTAEVLAIPEVKVQDWKPGDYPYGESGRIALVLQKNK